MKKSPFLILFLLLLAQTSYEQVYLEKQSRHRFAQLNLGFDVQTRQGGSTQFFNDQNVLAPYKFSTGLTSRILIGGTHFWGHADFYIAIPLFNPKQENEFTTYNISSGVETVFKYYPWKIKHKQIRPFIGCSIAPFYYQQNNNKLEFGNGPEKNHTSFPLIGGLTFNIKNHLFEYGLLWNYQNRQDYYISSSQSIKVNTPPVYINFSYRYMLETTVSAEKDWESGKTEKITQALSNEKRLDGFHLGAGMSSSFWLGESDYNTNNYSAIEKYSTSIMPDFSLGYYWNKKDINLALAYRSFGTSTNTYSVIQNLKRKSLALEATKFLFDYHGFVPFIGPLVSYDRLTFLESFEGQLNQNISENKLAAGITFGWDIRPTKIQTWILRTNLRWYPKLSLAVNDAHTIAFDNLEFNFIQMIIYPGRMHKRKG